MTSENLDIIFHVGLEKTATTYLQQSVFPNFKDILYVSKNNFSKVDEIIQENKNKKILISHEFGRRDFQNKIQAFAEKYPQTRPIIVLRRHDLWIASYYKFLVKRGLKDNFRDFFDIENDKGNWKREELFYFPEIQFLEKTFENKPLVLFHHDLKDNPALFIKQIADYSGVNDMYPVSIKPRHKSYNEKELIIRRWVTQNTIFREFYNVGHIKRYRMKRLYNRIIRYPTLYIAKMIPGAWVKTHRLIPEQDLHQIRDYYKADWDRCLNYARENNPQISVEKSKNPVKVKEF